ncbi:MAG: MXAN_5808 family serine peptidase, partial [Polyangiaceae bacterium]
RVAFTFDVEPELKDPEVKVEVSVRDDDLREGVAEKVRIPIAEPLTVAPSTGAVHARSGAGGVDLVNEPDASGRVFARLPTGVALATTGTVDGYVKVSLGDGRFGFAKAADLDRGGSPAGTPALEDAMAHAPPAIEIPQQQLATRDAHVPVRGSASDDARLLDAYIFVGARKIFYQSNRNGADRAKMAFDADVPLRPGVNIVTIVARENQDTTSRKTFIVRRDGPGGELLPTPKTDEELSESAGSDDE